MLKNISKKLVFFNYFAFLLLLCIFPSFFHLTFDLSHSNSFFISLLSTLLILFWAIKFGTNKIKPEFNMKFLVSLIIIFFVFIHGLLCGYLSNDFNYERFLLSLLYMSTLILSAYFFYLIKNKINDNILSKVITSFCYILLGLGFVSDLGFNFSGAAGKPIFYFDEPSKFALMFMPFFLYRFFKGNDFERLFLSGLSLKLALDIPSLTLLIPLFFTPFIFLKLKKTIKFYLLYLCIIFFTGGSNHHGYDLQAYVYERIPINAFLSFSSKNSINSFTSQGGISSPVFFKKYDGSSHSQNISASTAVFCSGWLRGILNFKFTNGLGLGFQQLGIYGLLDKYQIEFYPLSLLDGSTLGAKIFNEFGLIGALLLIAYIILFIFKVRSYRKMMNCPLNSNLNNMTTFLDVVYISYFVYLFIRGGGYFDPLTYFMIISLFSTNLSLYIRAKV